MCSPAALLIEAAARATSVYLVDRVVPMLPEHLSNNLCSLNPDEDKLSFSAIFEMDEKARLHGEWFGRSIMRSNKRFAYADAQAIIDGGKDEYQSEVLALYQISKILRTERMENGALEVGGNEVKFRLDEKGRPIEVYEKVMGPANWLIEEFMLLANKRVATWVSSRKGGAPPFVYRIMTCLIAKSAATACTGQELRAQPENRRPPGRPSKGHQQADARDQRHR